MKRFFILYLSILFTLSASVSCTNIDELSDDNKIAGFEILDHSPNTIEIQDAKIEGDVIYIPIVFGQSKFPLYFYGNVKITADIDRITGVDFSKEQCLQSPEDQIKFFIMAKSGLTRTYYIRPQLINEENNFYISESFKLKGVSPSTVPVSERGKRSSVGDTIKIYAVGGQDIFPLTLTPEFRIEEGAKFLNFTNGVTALKFDKPSTVHKVKVVALNKSECIWNIKLINSPIIKGSASDVSPAKKADTNIDPRKTQMSVSSGGLVVDEYFIDNANDEITVVLRDNDTKSLKAAINGSVDISLDLGLNLNNVELFNFVNQGTLTFSDYNQVKEFQILDSYNQVARNWRVKIKEWQGNGADVLSFSYDYTAADIITSRSWGQNKYGKSIDMNTSLVNIYPDMAEIHIHATTIRKEYTAWPYTSYPQKKWKLTLNNITMKLSKGASCTLPTFEWVSNFDPGMAGIGMVDNNCWTKPKSFKVIAEDGTQKDWSIKIIEPNNTGKSDKCELTSFRIDKYSPTYVVFDGAPLINADTKEIIIKIADIADEDYLKPLCIYPFYEYSAYASITSQNGNTEPLTFDSPTAVNTVTITAQDGITSSDWRVKLLPPSKAEGADVESFSATGITPATLQINSTQINKDRGEITVFISGMGTHPFAFDYSMVISDKATTGSLRGRYTFANVREVKSFDVKAQSGATKMWTVKFDYRPAIQGGDLDSWEGGNPLAPWSSGNNSFVTGTTSEERGGGRAAVLTSKTIIGEFAAGSLFLGYFKFDMGLKSDPISMTYFGTPLQATAKIKGIMVDLWYSAGPVSNGFIDYGAASVHLVDYNNKGNDPTYKNYEYHATYPDGSGPKYRTNNATPVAWGELFVSNETAPTYSKTPATVIPRGEWQNDMFIPLKYSNENVIPNYTHVHIVFGSSGEGAIFKGCLESTLKVDNVRLVYEE